jgi:hypothetical protein
MEVLGVSLQTSVEVLALRPAYQNNSQDMQGQNDIDDVLPQEFR